MRYGPASGGGPGLWATPSSATTFFLSFPIVRRRRGNARPPRASRANGPGALSAPRKRPRAPQQHPLAYPPHLPPSQQHPSSLLLSPPFPPSQRLLGLGGRCSARCPPRNPPLSRAPGRNPTPVGGEVTCFSSRLHMCRLHVAAHMSAHVRARGATVMRVSVRTEGALVRVVRSSLVQYSRLF